MEWMITVSPTSSALVGWEWVAVRKDRENVLRGAGYGTDAEALEAARVDIQAFESAAGVIKDATRTYSFLPEGVLPEVEPEPKPEQPAEVVRQ